MRIAPLILLTLLSTAAADPMRFQPGNGRQFAPYRAVCHLRVGSIQGSGTMIATRGDTALVLSCRHVCRRAGNRVTVTWPLAGKQVTQGQVIEVISGKGFDTDIALIVCGRPRGVRPIKVSRFSGANSPFLAAGWRDGLLRIATSSTAYEESSGLIVMPSAFIGGMSGGVMLDRGGSLVAVVVASDFVSQGVSVDGPRLRAAIDKYRKVVR